ncbi:hypothetical protein BC833DRAFT_583163 [Globomyces pollinis-pini]|nr:hypothetical protein BC833DRAFT_583163 [Globomyces pollinis-pini]
MLTPANFVLPCCIGAVILFGVLAIYVYTRALSSGVLINSTEFFLTAKNTQPWYRVAWGFYACSVGASAMFAIPQFVTDKQYGGGYLGLFFYSFFYGFPFIIIAYSGIYIKKRFPKVLSIGSYCKWRFGKPFATWVTLNVLFNLGIALCAELTAVGSLSNTLLGVSPWIPIVTVAIVTMIYTTVGGLYVSILTDQIQSIFILLILAIVGIFVAFNFRISALPPLPDYLGLTPVGEASVMTLGVALTSSTFFSDAIWQRVWAAKDDKALIMGAYSGAFLAMLVTFLFGFGGYIAAWAGLVNNPQTAFLELLKINGDIPLAMLLCICLISVTMNESAVDAFQIAISDTIMALLESFGLHVPLWLARVVLICLNIPFIIIGCLQFNIIGLYLITNLLTTCLILPLFLGLIPKLDRIVTGSAVLFGSLFALLDIVFYAIGSQLISQVGSFDLSKLTWDIVSTGIVTTFYLVYAWQPFAIGLLGSLLGVGIWVMFETLMYKVLGIERSVPNHLLTPVPTNEPKVLLSEADVESTKLNLIDNDEIVGTLDEKEVTPVVIELSVK